jgi:nucleoside-diphosphate-sugar epimerase
MTTLPTQQSTPSTVLILGARGRFGLAAVRAFAGAGWRVLAQMRPGVAAPADVQGPNAVPVEWLALDLTDTAVLRQAARGATVVVHAINPPYTNAAWQAQALPMLDAALDLCRALDATLMLPGNIYNFGVAMPAVLREGTPQQADTVKGRVRIAMEERLRASGVRGVVIRAGDFFGAGRGTWFDIALASKLQRGVFTYPGPLTVSTAWAYLPDLARTFVAVAERRDRLAPFAVLHFAGHVVTGQRWLDLLAPIAQTNGWVKPGAALRRAGMPWWLIRIGALWNPVWAALQEMRYLWSRPHALANDALSALIGPEPHTPLPQALQQALADLNLLAAPVARMPASAPTAVALVHTAP